MKKRSVKKGKPGNPMRSKADNEAIQAEIAKLDRRGFNQYQIAKAIGLSQPVVHMRLKKLVTEYRERRKVDYDASVQKKLEQYQELRMEAWEAYELSKRPAKKRIEEKQLRAQFKILNGPKASGKAKLQVVKQVRELIGRLPASQYMDIILRCLNEECKLEGLTQEVIFNQQNNQVNVSSTIDWSSMLDQPNSPPHIEIEKQIERAALPSPNKSHKENSQSDIIDVSVES